MRSKENLEGIDVDGYCYLIKKGKPSAMLPIPNEFINDAIEIVKKQNLSYFCKILSREDWKAFGYIDKINEEFVQMWIYKKPFMLEVIKGMPKRPKTVFDNWALGKALGYTEEAIEERLEEDI